MKIGDLEVPDSAVEAALKSLGKRVADEDDYIKKAEAAADLAKFRKVTGDDRSIEDIKKIIEAHEEASKKNKTQTELLMAETKRLQDALEVQKGEVKKAQIEVRKRDVKQYFDEAMKANKMPIIDPIIEPFRQEFYELDDTTITPEVLKAKVNDAIQKAAELQKGELLKLGLTGVSPDAVSSFGAGFTNPTLQVTPQRVQTAASEGDLFNIMREASATPMGVPLGKPPQR